MDEQTEIPRESDLSCLEESQQPCHSEEDSFVWDEASQLYYHARSGFYHDPNLGWYYSTRDGLYYKFEDGNYILLYAHEGDQSEIKGKGDSVICGSATCEQDCGQNDDQNQGFRPITSELQENPPPPSEWLEDTLIELYLSGYSNAASNAADEHILTEETHERDSSLMSTDGASLDEENWQAQYGQVVQEEVEHDLEFPTVDMWDWLMVKEMQEEGNCQVARIVGRLVRPSFKIHPSMPGGGRLRTAPICKTHLDLVQVRSGHVYKLRSPNAGYLATLSSYDASNPTKDWGFPEFSVEIDSKLCASNTALQVFPQQNTRLHPNRALEYEKKNSTYRDRAAERRALHGGFGVAPGQKLKDDASPLSSPVSISVEEPAAEALEMSFGAGSYAQKILRSMGWKEGDALGKTQRGLTEPLQGVGNKGTAGLGWECRARSKRR